MHWIAFFWLLSIAPLSAAITEQQACAKEIESIDKQVEKLEKQKQIHQDLAQKYQKLGDNWRYSSGNVQDAYANWGLAAQERRKAIDIQTEIDGLLQRKNRIIQFYPELYQP